MESTIIQEAFRASGITGDSFRKETSEPVASSDSSEAPEELTTAASSEKSESTQTSQPRRPRPIDNAMRRIEMVNVVMGRTPEELLFKGLFLEGKDSKGLSRNRIIAMSKFAPDWFIQECRRIAQNYSEKKVRIVVTRTSKNAVAFAEPATESLEQLNVEWERLQAEEAKQPTRLADCAGLASANRLLIVRATKLWGLTLLQMTLREKKSFGIAQENDGYLFKIVGMEQLWAQRDKLDADESNLDDLIQKHMRGLPIYNLKNME